MESSTKPTFITLLVVACLWVALITSTVNNIIIFVDYDSNHVDFVTYISRRLDALHPRRPETELAFFKLNHHEKTDTVEIMEGKIKAIKERRKWVAWNESNPYVRDILSVNPTNPNKNNIFKRNSGNRGKPVTPVSNARKPNILLILADDLGYGDLGVSPFVAANAQEAESKFPCMEGAILTPNLVKMAASGTIMVNFHSASPVCSPSRVAIMTGLFPWRLHAMNAFELGRDLSQRNGFLPQVPTGAEIFREAGYYTIHSGKWHIGGMREEMRVDRAQRDVCIYGSPNQHGFEEYTSALDGPESPRYTFLNRNSELHSKGHRHRIKDDIPYPYACGQTCSKPGKDTEVLSDVEALDALDVIRRLAKENPRQPWYSQIWFNAPHGPWEIVPSGVEPYNKKYVKTSDAWKKKCKEGNHEFSPWESQYFKYKTMVTAMDASIGIILDTIREIGIENDTLIVFTSDNGPEMGSGTAGIYREGKRSLMEGGIRVPAFFQWVGKIPANKVSTVFGGTVDLLPTFLDAAGLVKPPSIKIDGISILSALTGTVSDMKVHKYRNTTSSERSIKHMDENSLMNLVHSGVESISSNIKNVGKAIANATERISNIVSTAASDITAVPKSSSFRQNKATDGGSLSLNDMIAIDLASTSRGGNRRRLLSPQSTINSPSSGVHRRGGLGSGFRDDEMKIKTRVFLWHKDTDPYSRDERIQSAGYYEELKIITSSYRNRKGCIDRIFDLRHDPRESKNLVVGSNTGEECKIHLENYNSESLASMVDKTAAKTHCKSGSDQDSCMLKYHTMVVTKALHILERLHPFVVHGSDEHAQYMKLDKDKATCDVPIASTVRKLRFFDDANVCIKFSNCSSPEH